MSFAADEAVWIRRLLLEVGFAIPGVHHIRSRTDDDDDDVFPSVETQTESWIESMRPKWLFRQKQFDRQAHLFNGDERTIGLLWT